MRKIKVEKWISQDPQGKDVDETTLNALTILISVQDPQTMPKGLEKFKLFKRIHEAFEKAKKTGFIKLEETEYSFLKQAIETNVPAFWAVNPDISKAIESFLEAKEEQ